MRPTTRRQKDRHATKSPETSSSFCRICFFGDEAFLEQDPIHCLISCHKCAYSVHTWCLGLKKEFIENLLNYDWECGDCKLCHVCHDPKEDDKMVLCDGCDRGEHLYCAIPTLKEVPRGVWYCRLCENLDGILKSNKHHQDKRPEKMANEESTIVITKKGNGKETEKEKRRENERKKEKEKKRVEKTTNDPEDETLKHREKAKIIKLVPRNPKEPLPTYRQLTLSFAGKEIAQVDGASDMSKQSRESPSKHRRSKVTHTPGMDLDHYEPDIIPDLRCQPDALNENLFDQARHKVLELRKSAINSGPLPKIKHVSFGRYLMDTWFMSPYPEEYNQQKILYICEFCLKYMNNSDILQTHAAKCPWRHPPGDEIYRKEEISIFEVDGRKSKLYCQNLCLLAKMYLDHKTLYYDVEPFLFYVMTEYDEEGCHFAGYFSKEKKSPLNYNVSCIVTLPNFQRKGYGQLLIDFSYLLSKKEGKTGSPEKPLSDFGLLSYRSYWKNVILDRLIQRPSMITINDLSRETSITVDDIISTLHWLGFLRRKDEQQSYFIQVNDQVLEEHIRKKRERNFPQIDPSCLQWTPFCVTSFLKYHKSSDSIDEQQPIDVEHE